MRSKILVILILFISVGMLLSCGTSRENQQTDRSVPGEVRSDQINTSLADVLRKNTSLEVSGVGNNVRVFVRGMGSIKLNTQPLFVIDNVPVGNTYAMANNAINPSDIYRVRVLRSLSETTTVWGEQGNHGVILIQTKKARRKK